MTTAGDVGPGMLEFLYVEASEALHDEARRDAMDGLVERFPHVSALQWWQAYHHCQPDIWVFDGQATMAGEGVRKLTAWVTLIHGPAADEVEVYKPVSLYLASRFALGIARIQGALATSGEQLTQQALEAHLQSLYDLDQKDLICKYLWQERSPTTRHESRNEAQYFPATTQDEMLALDGQTDVLVVAQWRALRDWLARENNALCPWDVNAFQFYLKWPKPLIERVLFPTDMPFDDPAEHPTVFTLERLVQIQVLLLTYRFPLPS